MENILSQEMEIIKRFHLGGEGIMVTAHAPQRNGGCHPFVFLRGVFPNETFDDTFQRVKQDILQHIFAECGRSCQCNSGKPAISYKRF